MHTYVRRALQTALVSGGLLAAGAVAAQATPHDGAPGIDVVVGSTTHTLVALSLGTGSSAPTAVDAGPLVEAPVAVPVDVSDVAVAVLGDATVASGDPAAGAGDGGDPAVAPEAPVPSPGALVSAPVEVPVDVSDVAVAVLGDASTAAAGSPSGPAEGDAAGTARPDAAAGPAVVAAPVTVPVEVSGVAAGVLGDGDVATGSSGDGTDTGARPAAPVREGVAGASGASLVAVPVSVPLTVSGVALGALADATVARVADGSTGGAGADGGSAPAAPAAPGAPGRGSGVGSAAPGGVTPADGVLGAGGQTSARSSEGSGAGAFVGVVDGGVVGAGPAGVSDAGPVALARAGAAARPSDALGARATAADRPSGALGARATAADRPSVALAARAGEAQPVAVLAETGSELWLVPVALVLVAGGLWLRGRAHRAAAHHPGRITFVPHQRGASDGS